MNMAASKGKAPPVPKKAAAKGRINEGSYAVEYFFNETEPDAKKPSSKRNVNSVPRKSPFTKGNRTDGKHMQIVPERKSRFKTESNEDSPLIDSCEEDGDLNIDECDIDSYEL